MPFGFGGLATRQRPSPQCVFVDSLCQAVAGCRSRSEEEGSVLDLGLHCTSFLVGFGPFGAPEASPAGYKKRQSWCNVVEVVTKYRGYPSSAQRRPGMPTRRTRNSSASRQGVALSDQPVASMIFCAWPWPRVATARCRSKRGGITWRPSTEYLYNTIATTLAIPCGRGQESCRHYTLGLSNRSMSFMPCHAMQATVRKGPKQNKVLDREWRETHQNEDFQSNACCAVWSVCGPTIDARATRAPDPQCLHSQGVPPPNWWR